MKRGILRNESTGEGKKIWEAVDKAASRAPEWIKARIYAIRLPAGDKVENPQAISQKAKGRIAGLK